MTEDYYNDIIQYQDQYYFVQEAEFLEQPMIRPVQNLLQPEKQEIQKVLQEWQ